MTESIRIHGDNILECENALKLIAEAISPGNHHVDLIGGTPYSPIYRAISDSGRTFEAQLFPGYGRWGFDFINYLIARGAPLREATDAIITKLKKINGQLIEDPILAMEFCGALPAGNNAWQRCGRALSSAFARIPYIYYAELGGLELDSERNEKASRFPNPLIPFAYISLGQVEETPAVPVFIPSPSARDATHSEFKECFGESESKTLIRNIILGEDYSSSLKTLQSKAEKVVEVLASRRKRNDSLSPDGFDKLIKLASGKEKADWLLKQEMPWKKKTGIKDLTNSFNRLMEVSSKVA